MKSVLNSMKKPKNAIPEDLVLLFEDIVQTTSDRKESEEKFVKAMEEHLTTEQRYRLYAQNGSCRGTKYDKDRKAFAFEHSDKPLAERLKLFTDTTGLSAVLSDEKTITVTFACHHGYYKHAPKGKFEAPGSLESYFEKCAGGRLYELEKALGIKLKIKSVDISPLNENIINPVIFTFEIIG